MPYSHVFQPLDTLGTGLGDTNANVDGSVTPVEFKFTAATRT